MSAFSRHVTAKAGTWVRAAALPAALPVAWPVVVRSAPPPDMSLHKIAKLRNLGIRFVFDPSYSSHRDGDVRQYLDVEWLSQGPPLSLLSPLVGVVFGDTVCFLHKCALSAGHIVTMVAKNDPSACKAIKLWGTRIELVCINPPSIASFPAYIASQVYGCQCRHCVAMTPCTFHAIRRICDYCGDAPSCSYSYSTTVPS